MERCVYEDMTAAEARRDDPARAAALLRDAGLRPGELAPHLLATEPAGDADVVALPVRQPTTCSGRALRTSRGLPARALREPPTAGRWSTSSASWAQRNGCAGRSRGAIDHLRDALERTDDPSLRPARALALHQAVFVSGRLLEAYELLEQEIERLTGIGEPEASGGWRRLVVDRPAAPGHGGHANVPTGASEGLAGRRPELLQIANVACWKWAAGTAAETAEDGERPLAPRARRRRCGGLDPDLRGAVGARYADAHDLALSVLDDTLADARSRLDLRHLHVRARALIACSGATSRAEKRAHGSGAPRSCRASSTPLFGMLALALVARDLAKLRGRSRRAAAARLPQFVCLNPVFYARGVLRPRRGAPRTRSRTSPSSVSAARRSTCATRATLAPGRRRGSWPRRCTARPAGWRMSTWSSRSWGTTSAVGIALHGQALAYGADPEGLAAASALAIPRTTGPRPQPGRPGRGAPAGEPPWRRATPLRDGLKLAHLCGAGRWSARAGELRGGRAAAPADVQRPEAYAQRAAVAELAAEGLPSRRSRRCST